MFITLIIGLVNISLSSAEYEDEITDDAIEDSKYVLQNHLNQKVIILNNLKWIIRYEYISDIEYFSFSIYF